MMVKVSELAERQLNMLYAVLSGQRHNRYVETGWLPGHETGHDVQIKQERRYVAGGVDILGRIRLIEQLPRDANQTACLYYEDSGEPVGLLISRAGLEEPDVSPEPITFLCNSERRGNDQTPESTDRTISRA
jgi:hypothetical protein